MLRIEDGNEIVLDFFSGSASVAQAVLESKSGRKKSPIYNSPVTGILRMKIRFLKQDIKQLPIFPKNALEG